MFENNQNENIRNEMDSANLRNQLNIMQSQHEDMKIKKENAIAKLLESQTKWTSFAKDILSISKELFKAIHTLEAHKPVPKEFLEKSLERMQKYEHFLNESENTFKHAIKEEDEAIPEEEDIQSSTQIDNLFESQMQSNISLAALDYKKVKQFLATSKDDLKICALLQALKWRLMRAQKGYPRKEIIQWFIIYDILDCNNAKNHILEKLLLHSNKK